MLSEYKKELDILKSSNEAPNWLSIEGYITLSNGYMLKDETPKSMYRRVSKAAAKYLGILDLEEKFFDYMYNKNWLCPASPILSNSGTERGLNISCYGLSVSDSVKGICSGIDELSALTKNGGGVGINFDNIRARGSYIRNGENGKTDGIIGFAKMYDSTILAMSQGNVRRGAAVLNLNIEHGDWYEFIRMRRPEGDILRQCPTLHQCTIINDEFMNKVQTGNLEARLKWVELMKARIETGESYILYLDNANRDNPKAYTNNQLEVNMTNLCSEILLHTDEEHSFICCLSSLNLTQYDNWKDTDLPYIGTLFLNGILNEFIEKSKNIHGLHKARLSAIKGRAIGLGVLGWHTLLQSKALSFSGFETMMLNRDIFSFIEKESIKASQYLASRFGEPEWCKGTGMHNTHLTALAPTRSNSIISGDVSFGIEPIVANAYTDKTSKGTFIRRNKQLAIVLDKYQKNTDKIWKDIARNNGSVQDLTFLTDNEKEVFKTAYEIDQNTLIQQAAQRQKYICQGQSLNLFFPTDIDPNQFSTIHINAWELGVKTLYYCRSKSGIKADIANRDSECENCEA